MTEIEKKMTVIFILWIHLVKTNNQKKKKTFTANSFREKFKSWLRGTWYELISLLDGFYQMSTSMFYFLFLFYLMNAVARARHARGKKKKRLSDAKSNARNAHITWESHEIKTKPNSFVLILQWGRQPQTSELLTCKCVPEVLLSHF